MTVKIYEKIQRCFYLKYLIQIEYDSEFYLHSIVILYKHMYIILYVQMYCYSFIICIKSLQC